MSALPEYTSGGCTRLLVVEGRKREKQAAFGFPASQPFYSWGIVPWQPVRATADGAQAAEQGVTAFRAGDYQAALQSFLDALAAGLDTPGLRYNLGAYLCCCFFLCCGVFGVVVVLLFVCCFAVFFIGVLGFLYFVSFEFHWRSLVFP